MKKMFLLMAVALGMLVGCSEPGLVYSNSISLDGEGWHKDTIAQFAIDVDDNVAKHDVWLMLRNSNEYAYRNLWLFVDIEQPDGKVITDTIECMLANNTGEWIGKGWGSLYSSQFPLLREVQFKEKGTYTFSFKQAMRADDIDGMHSIGVKVIRKEGNE